jgi:LysM repeat protein
MKTNKTENDNVLEREMRRIFKHICHDNDECNATVKDAMKAFTMIKQENQQFISSTSKSYNYDS